MPVKALKRIWEVCEPHPDVFARDIDPSMFAASLHAVESGTADRDYTDPERFFAKTFMTRSLENVLEGVLARLMGEAGRGAPVMRLETPFGGGKTHTMIALYHPARNPEAVEATEAGERLCERLNVHHLPSDISLAVLDGVALGEVVTGREVDGLTIRTLWGELAYRLGGKGFYEAIRNADEARISPGQAKLARMLRETQPVMILMDEVMHYLARARAIRVGDSNLMEQTAIFIRELTTAVDETPQSVLVLSLPASSLEIPMDREQAEWMFQHVRKVLGRTELIETPVAEDEVFGVLKRRLFRSVGTERTAKRVINAFSTYYDEYARFFPERLRRPQYRERMINAYPFHPEMVDLLYGRWGPHPQFQRTRGALVLLARVIRRLWNGRPASAFLIQPHHIDLADRYIRAEVVRLLDTTFDAIATGDVVNRAREIDRELGGEYAREELAKGAATCAFLYSVSAAMDFTGCTEEELRIALLRPEINPAQVSEVLGRLRNNLWFLRYRDRRYFFTAKPNLNKIILDYEQGISDEQVDEAIVEHLKEISGAGKSALQVITSPQDESTVPDQAHATLVILPLSLSDPKQAREWMKNVVDRATNRNMLIFLTPEKGREGAVRSCARRWLALKAIKGASIFRELDKEDRDDVNEQFKEKETELAGLLFTIYSRLFRPAGEGVQEVRVTLRRDAKTLAQAVEDALKERGDLIESITPDYLVSALGVGERPVSVTEVETVLTGSPDQPIAVKPKEAVKQAIREGVELGRFAVKSKEKIFKDEVPEDVLNDPNITLVPTEALTEEVEEEKVTPLSLKMELSAKNIYPVRKVLELLQGTDVSITVQIHDRKGEVAKKRDELEGILRDYSVPHQWEEE
ncbi:ATP-binding protein [Candidatus Poribacteria bacterium]|nr:ATP-binding protein [Candidatus Poribacteria bacterium]